MKIGHYKLRITDPLPSLLVLYLQKLIQIGADNYMFSQIEPKLKKKHNNKS